jgi:hypothetical protein
MAPPLSSGRACTISQFARTTSTDVEFRTFMAIYTTMGNIPIEMSMATKLR